MRSVSHVWCWTGSLGVEEWQSVGCWGWSEVSAPAANTSDDRWPLTAAGRPSPLASDSFLSNILFFSTYCSICTRGECAHGNCSVWTQHHSALHMVVSVPQVRNCAVRDVAALFMSCHTDSRGRLCDQLLSGTFSLSSTSWKLPVSHWLSVDYLTDKPTLVWIGRNQQHKA